MSSIEGECDEYTLIRRAQADFAVRIIKESFKLDDTSIIVSSYSMAVALAMVYAGARGQTAAELAQLLGGSDSEVTRHRLHSYFKKLLSVSAENGVELLAANRVYIKQGLDVLPSYRDTLSANYQGGFELVNFEDKTAAATTINRFVEDVTKHKILNLVLPHHITEATRLVLVNATYFKAEWMKKFDHSNLKRPFHFSLDKSVNVAMMSKSFVDLDYLETDTLQVVRMPYCDDRHAMYIILPRRVDGLSEIIDSLDAEQLSTLFHTQHDGSEVIVTMPKFEVTKTMNNVPEILMRMGVHDAFNERADFTGIIDGNEPFQIGAILHKAYVKTDESGTEAAAATATMLLKCCMPPAAQKKVLFVADHPFLFFITSDINVKSTILFSGVVRDKDALKME